MRLIDADALKEDFKARLRKAQNWKENALNRGDDEIVIRADATISFICEVIMTINNAPTVEPFEPDYVGAERLKARQRGYEEGYHNGMKIGKTLNPKIKQGKWIKKVDNAGFVSYICSVCGAEIEVEDCSDDKFCFNCGAKMKGGAE